MGSIKAWMLFLVFLLPQFVSAGSLPYCDIPDIEDFQLMAGIYQQKALNDDDLDEYQLMLTNEAPDMSPYLKKRVINSLDCAQKYKLYYQPRLAVIDFSLPSSKKRLWVFDLKSRKLLFHSYISHGIRSGKLKSMSFSNRNNSKATSIGLYKTGSAYYGRHGLSLKLIGLDRGFNDQAYNRFIVIHGGWYVNDDFIRQYGRAGRSWGCPALPTDLTKKIINSIKDDALLLAYYPDINWLSQSKYLNCQRMSMIPDPGKLQYQAPEMNENRGEIVYVEKNNDNKREENEAIITMSAKGYQQFFQLKPPVNRMLRRPLHETEYIALNENELREIVQKAPTLFQKASPPEQQIYFVIPYVHNKRGYWATEMKAVDLGIIKKVEADAPSESKALFTLHFENKPNRKIYASDRFIRWLGL